MLKRVALILLALGVVAFLSPANAWWVQWYAIIPNRLLDLLIDGGRIIGIALVLAGLLAPFEALGWWAGWYGGDYAPRTLRDRDKTTLSFEHSPLETQKTTDSASHYVVYLDGIGKSSFKYSFRSEKFLQRLAESLPSDRVLIQNIIPYSVINLPLTLNRPLAKLWQWIERTANFGFLVLLRNMFQVAVSVDSRYGPIYNRGTAQIIIDRLLSSGYQPGSGKLITLIGYSGGGQISLGALPYLKRVLAAPIEVISLAGVISGNNEVAQVEHLYHLVGRKDRVARLTPLLFPRRWRIISWSNWNLAKSRGEISFISLGKMGHDSSNGPLDEAALLTDGSNHLEKTLSIILRILTKVDGYEPYPAAVADYVPKSDSITSDYRNYVKARFNQPDYYPISADYRNYLPVASWMGRLILPDVTERSQVNGVYFEVHHAPEADLIGKTVYLRWSDRPDIQAYVNQVKIRIDFSKQAYESMNQGIIHPSRLNHWRQVQALESLAGARPNDDVIVALGSVELKREPNPCLYISREPIVITGEYYALVSFTEVFPNNLAAVRFYNPDSGEFDSKESVVYLPEVVPDRNGVLPATSHKITESPLNKTGWYIYGAKNHQGMFTVRAIAPRSSISTTASQGNFGAAKNHRLHAQSLLAGSRPEKKGQIDSILLNPNNLPDEKLINSYKEGDRLLLLHTYGGIGGKKKELAP